MTLNGAFESPKQTKKSYVIAGTKQYTLLSKEIAKTQTIIWESFGPIGTITPLTQDVLLKSPVPLPQCSLLGGKRETMVSRMQETQVFVG